MMLENQILNAVIQDHKERTVLGISPFGDIFFKEANGYGEELFSICQIVPPIRPSDNTAKKGEFMFRIKVVALSKKAFKGILMTGLERMFNFGTLPKNNGQREVLLYRYGLYTELQQRLGKLAKDEVYGYCDDDDYNSTNPYAAKVHKLVYLKEVLVYATDYPRAYYTDIYDLARHDTSVPFILKDYFGYGFSLPEELLKKLNLKALAIYQQSINDLTPQKLLGFKNLNSLCLDNVDGVPQNVFDIIHQIPYLVELSLCNTDKFRGRNKFTQIPKQLYSLQSLRYFSFAGNELQDWSEIVKLKNLRTLDVSHCGLTAISEQISQLEFLEELNLSNNKIEQLSDEIAQLKNLKILRLNGNQLEALPTWINELKNLEELDVTQTGLTTLPNTLTELTSLTDLQLKKNPFKTLPKSLLKFPKKIVQIEMRNQALYDPKAKAKLDKYPKGSFKFESDINFKLMVINQLMYVDGVLLPKFDIWEFAKNHKNRKIDIEKEGYEPIPEALDYFKNLKIPMDLLIDIKELKPDGGDEIYGHIIPFWDGEDEQFNVASIKDVIHLPNLKATNNMNFTKELVKELRTMKIKVSSY